MLAALVAVAVVALAVGVAGVVVTRDDDGDDAVATIPERAAAVAGRPEFEATPAFTQMGEVRVPVGDGETMLGDSGIQYLRRGEGFFDDESTEQFDAVAKQIRAFLACETDRWSINVQMFASDLVTAGVNSGDRTLVEKGIAALDWGIGVEIGDDAVHVLHRDCDGKTVRDFAETHATSQWLEGLTRSVFVLRASPYADDYRDELDAYVTRAEEVASLMVEPDNWRSWTEDWLVDGDGNLYTHKTFMRAAGLGMAAALTDDREDAAYWAAIASAIARRGIDEQWPEGVNPEKGGYDVSYQMYGTWLAQVYWSLLPDGDPLKARLERTIDRGIRWMGTRIDDRSGRIDIGTSTRTCIGEGFERPADAVRVFLFWGWVNDDPELVDRALLVERAAAQGYDGCAGR